MPAESSNPYAKPYLSPGELWHIKPCALDDAAVEFFVNGHCASMALALHELTGWPMFGLKPKPRKCPECGHTMEECSHAVVEPERGCYVDAEGPGAWFRYRESRG